MLKEAEKRALMLFKILGNSTRYLIIKSLYEGEKNVSRLCEITKKKSTTISKHLLILKELDIVSYRTEENRVFYRLKKADVVEVIDIAVKCMERNKK